MIDDILTVMWKERKGLFRQGGSRTRAVLTLLVPMVMLAIVLPLQMGHDWLETPWSLVASVLLPAILAGTMIPESFAGERERHTLGTLLASRLPDQAILFGKVAVAIAYAWGMTLIVLLLSLVIVNIVHWDGQVMLYAPGMALANVASSLLVATLMASLGVLISLRAATVQGATQALMVFIMAPLLLLQIGGFLLLSVVPDGRARLKEMLEAANPTQIILIVMAVLVVVNLGLLWVAMARFQRARLILD